MQLLPLASGVTFGAWPANAHGCPRAWRLGGRQKSEAGGWEGEQGWPRPSLSPKKAAGTLQPCSTRAQAVGVSGVQGAGPGRGGERQLGMHVCGSLSCCGAEGGVQMAPRAAGWARTPLAALSVSGMAPAPGQPVDVWGPRKSFLLCSSGIPGFTPGPDPWTAMVNLPEG